MVNAFVFARGKPANVVPLKLAVSVVVVVYAQPVVVISIFYGTTLRIPGITLLMDKPPSLKPAERLILVQQLDIVQKLYPEREKNATGSGDYPERIDIISLHRNLP